MPDPWRRMAGHHDHGIDTAIYQLAHTVEYRVEIEERVLCRIADNESVRWQPEPAAAVLHRPRRKQGKVSAIADMQDPARVDAEPDRVVTQSVANCRGAIRIGSKMFLEKCLEPCK